jgi:hypothetical protein
MPGDARAATPAGICPASIRARSARTAIRSACSRLVIIEVPSPIQIGGDARGRLPGCRARPLSGRRRLIPHSRRRARVTSRRCAAAARVVTTLERAGNRAIRAALHAGLAPRAFAVLETAGRRTTPPAPPLLRSSPNTLAHRRARPVIGVARRRTQAVGLRSRGRSSRPLSLSRPRAWTSLARSRAYGTGAAKSRGPRSRGRGAALALRGRGDRRAEWISPCVWAVLAW